jgi:hypothetical protein
MGGTYMRSWRIAIILTIVFAAVFSSAASAEQDLGLYRHDDKQYWWYYADEVNFWAVVPSKENSHAADHYLKKTVLGYEFLEISWYKDKIVMEVGALPNSTVSGAIDFVAKRWSPFLKDELVFANREITTSNNLKAHFYAVEGVGPDGVKYMLRSVFFNRAGSVAYLAMYIPSGKYQGAMQNNWIKAVNESEWE